ncbi:MAG TPA: hypothetical protein VGD07_15435 [Methylomirabilota bacterium]
MTGDVRAGLNRQHQVECDQVEGVTVSPKLIGGGLAPGAHTRQVIGQLAQLAGDEVAINHHAPRDATRASHASRIRANQGSICLEVDKGPCAPGGHGPRLGLVDPQTLLHDPGEQRHAGVLESHNIDFVPGDP